MPRISAANLKNSVPSRAVRKKKLLLDSLLAFISFAVSLCVAEFVLRVLPVTDKLGWVRIPSLSQRVKRFDKKTEIKVVALGDSLVAWRTGEGVNMFDRIPRNILGRKVSVLNLGVPGVNLKQYVETYKNYVVFQPDYIFLCIYMGDDMLGYGDADESAVIDASALPASKWKEFFRRHSVLLNSLYRIAKKLGIIKSGALDNNLRVLQKQSALSDDFIALRKKKIDPHMLHLAQSDMVNPRTVAYGIVNPSYYKELFGMRSQYAYDAAETMIMLVKDFNAQLKDTKLIVIFIPESLQVSQMRDSFFTKCGFDIENFPLQERRTAIEYIYKKLTEAGITAIDVTPLLRQSGCPYMSYDTHLNRKGHLIMGNFMTAVITADISKR